MPAAKPRLYYSCAECGKSFSVIPSRLKLGIPKYCKRACEIAHRRKAVGAHFQETICQNCGKRFAARRCYLKRGQYRYCSDTCRKAANRHNIPKEDLRRECVTCGKIFFAKPSRLDRAHCSIKCRERKDTFTCSHCGCQYQGLSYRRGSTRFCSNQCYKRSMPETTIEAAVREFLQAASVPFEQQVGFNRYVVDFLLPERKTIIEADGGYWHDKSSATGKRRPRRDAHLEKLGYTVVHLSEEEIKSGAFRETLAFIL